MEGPSKNGPIVFRNQKRSLRLHIRGESNKVWLYYKKCSIV